MPIVLPYKAKEKEVVFALYAQGLNATEIARDFFKGRPSRQTISKWINKEKWEERKQKIAQTMRETLDTDLASLNQRNLKVIGANISKHITQLNEGKLVVSPSDAVRLIQLERLIVGEPTERVENIFESRLKQWLEKQRKQMKSKKSSETQ